MFVYMSTTEPRPRCTSFVTPPRECGNADGSTITIAYIHGRAEVPDNLGRWLVDTGRARSSRQLIIIPEGVDV